MLGDSVIATGVIEPLKRAFPHSQLYFLVRKEYIPLLSAIPEISGFIEEPLSYQARFPHDMPPFLKLVKTLKSHRFDGFIGLWETPRYSLLAKLAGIPLRIGHRVGVWNRMFYTHTYPWNPQNYTRHQAEKNCDLLRLMGLSEPYGRLQLKTDPQIESQLLERWPFLKQPFCLLDLNCKNPQKLLLPNQFQAITDYLLNKKQTRVVLFMNTPESHQTSQYLHQTLDHPHLFSLPLFSLPELAVVIEHARLFICPDSGPCHIAAALGRPTLVYYLNRNQSASQWGPWKMSAHRVLHSNHDCPDICQSTLCRKMTCRIPVDIKEFQRAINALLSSSPSLQETQKRYWFRQSVQIGMISPNPQLENYLKKNHWKVFTFSGHPALFALKQFIIDRNIALLIIPPSTVTFYLKVSLARILASSGVSHYPKIWRLSSPKAFLEHADKEL